MKKYSLPSFNPERVGLYLGLTILPFNPILGVLPLLFAFLSPWIRCFKRLATAPTAKGWGILAIWLIFTTLIAQDKGEAALGLANFLPYFALFIAFSQVVRRFAHLERLAWLLTGSGLLLVVLGLGQVYGDWQSPGWLTAIGTNLVAGGRPEGRMSSLLMYTNLLSAWLLLIFPLSLGLLIQARRGWGRAKIPTSPLLVWGLAATCVLEAIALGLTDSRSAWGIGLLIGVIYAVYLSWYWLVGLAGVITGMVLWAAFGPMGKAPLRQIVPRAVWGRLSDELYPDRSLTALRSTQWQFASQMFTDRPLTGWGLRNFTPLYEQAMNVWLGHPHSLPLMLLAETGLVGTALMLGLVGWILWRAVRLLITLAQFSQSPRRQGQFLLLMSYLVGFGALCLYNLTDVTLFDLRNNLLSWSYLAAIAGVTEHYDGRLQRPPSNAAPQS
ncbi:MAG: hypothetical protein RLZZ568_573 [Cyanobacteriota bacterium]